MATMTLINTDAHRKCQGCKSSLPLASFPLKTRGNFDGWQRTKRCVRCNSQISARKENQPIAQLREDGGLPLMEFEQILTMLGTLDRGEVEIEVRASFSKTFWSDHAGVGPKARSKIIADRIGSTIGFRFVFHAKTESRKDSGITKFRYHCSQSKTRVHTPQKVNDVTKQRDRRPMDSFECNGWLKISFDQRSDQAWIKLNHKDDHMAYRCVNIPESIRRLVVENSSKLTVSQIWEQALQQYPTPMFSRKAIYALWDKHHRTRFPIPKDKILPDSAHNVRAVSGLKRPGESLENPEEEEEDISPVLKTPKLV